MRAHRFALAMPVLFAALSPALTIGSTPAAAQTPYDGLWQVTVYTKSGSCEPTARYPLQVIDGKVQAASGASGSVSSSGMVRVSLGGAHANGQLSGNGGSGKWNAASGGMPCSGRWEASRQ